jgi:hypothetical protein
MSSPASNRIFQTLIKYDQQLLPTMATEIANGVSVHNTKERITELHRLLSIITRYMILENAEKHGVDPTKVLAVAPHGGSAPALMAPQHFPASATMALGAPPMATRTQNVMVGSEPQLGQTVVGSAMEEPEPVPTDVVQILRLKDGRVKVIPPLGYDVTPRIFAANEPVDAAYYVPKATDPLLEV